MSRLVGMCSSGNPLGTTPTQFASGAQRFWLSLMATSGMSVNSSSSSGMPATSSRPCKVVTTGTGACRANGNPNDSTCECTMSNRSASAQHRATARSMWADTSPR